MSVSGTLKDKLHDSGRFDVPGTQATQRLLHQLAQFQLSDTRELGKVLLLDNLTQAFRTPVVLIWRDLDYCGQA